MVFLLRSIKSQGLSRNIDQSQITISCARTSTRIPPAMQTLNGDCTVVDGSRGDEWMIIGALSFITGRPSQGHMGTYSKATGIKCAYDATYLA